MARSIGVRAHDYGKRPLAALLRAIAGDGWQTIQLAYPKAAEGIRGFDDVNTALVTDTKVLLEETGLSAAVLGVYVEPSLTEEALRKEQVRFLREALPWAKALEAGCVGTETTSFEKQKTATPAEAYRSLCQSLAELLPTAEALGVTLAVEPVWYHTLSAPELARALLKELGSPRLKIIFDPVNLLRPEELRHQDALWGRCMDCFGGDIAAIHIKSVSPEDGRGMRTPLSNTALDYACLFSRIKDVKAPFLREMAIPAAAAEDIALLRSYLSI